MENFPSIYLDVCRFGENISSDKYHFHAIYIELPLVDLRAMRSNVV